VRVYDDGALIAPQTGEGYGDAFAAPEGIAHLKRTDTLISCDAYTDVGLRDFATRTYPARRYSRLTDVDSFWYYGLGNSERYREYLVYDNYDQRYRYMDGPEVSESYEPFASNGRNLQSVQIGDGWLNSQGRFSRQILCERYPDLPAR
jgi:hypothetical protein